MKSTHEITAEIVRSIVNPAIEKIVWDNGSNIDEITDALLKTDLELHQFIDFVKHFVIAIKMAYRIDNDRRPFYELVGIFLKELEKIGGYSDHRYDNRLSDVVTSKLSTTLSSKVPLNQKIDTLLEMSHDFIEIVESDYKTLREELYLKRKGKVAAE